MKINISKKEGPFPELVGKNLREVIKISNNYSILYISEDISIIKEESDYHCHKYIVYLDEDDEDDTIIDIILNPIYKNED